MIEILTHVACRVCKKSSRKNNRKKVMRKIIMRGGKWKMLVHLFHPKILEEKEKNAWNEESENYVQMMEVWWVTCLGFDRLYKSRIMWEGGTLNISWTDSFLISIIFVQLTLRYPRKSNKFLKVICGNFISKLDKLTYT